jgi:hypothetical protein
MTLSSWFRATISPPSSGQSHPDTDTPASWESFACTRSVSVAIHDVLPGRFRRYELRFPRLVRLERRNAFFYGKTCRHKILGMSFPPGRKGLQQRGPQAASLHPL